MATSLREVFGIPDDLAEFFRHLSGQHDQKTHGRKGAGEILADKAVMNTADLAALSGMTSDEQFGLVIGSRAVIADGQAKVTEAFNELPDDVREVALGRLEEVSEVRHRFGQIEGSDRVIGAYDPSDKSMDVSLVRPADGGGVRLVTADEYADNFMHELGHAVDFRGGTNSAAENGIAGQFMTRQARRQYQAGDDNLWYAASHPREMAAEAFKGYTRGAGGLSPSQWRDKYPDLVDYVEVGMNK